MHVAENQVRVSDNEDLEEDINKFCQLFLETVMFVIYDYYAC